jgi:Zinc finger, C2H2 type
MIGIMAAASNYRRSGSSPKEHRCSICGRVFDSAETLNSHKRIDHSQEGYQLPAGVSWQSSYT